MAVNPMQRKSRNSLLIGLIIGLVIAAGVGFLLFRQINKLNQQIDEETKAKTMVYVLKEDVVANQTITAEMCNRVAVSNTAVPANATGDIDTLLNNISTSEGEGDAKPVIAAVDMRKNTVITTKTLILQNQK